MCPSCRKQIISFVVSSLTEPDVFGPTGLIDLLKTLGSASLDAGNALSMLMRELADELYAQKLFDEV